MNAGRAREPVFASLEQVLQPPVSPYHAAYLAVDEPHELYHEWVGNPNGIPAVVLHGGPGSGCNPAMRRYFDAERYRVLLFDQRGAGRSRPAGELSNNSTSQLVGDIEALRQHFGVDRWLVFGGSWGATLALAYAQQFPASVSGLILRGVFLGTADESAWLMGGGAGRIHPEAWEAFRQHIPADEQSELMAAYGRRLDAADAGVRTAAALAWNAWETGIMHLPPVAGIGSALQDEALAVARARIECHYFRHNFFLSHADQLIRDLPAIRHLPAKIIHGRYDMVCPLQTAWRLARAWPEAELRIVPLAGHSANDVELARALLLATGEFAAAYSRHTTAAKA